MADTVADSDCIEDAPELPANLDETLAFVTGKIRTMVPDYSCEHNDPFCLSCGLKRLVEDSVLFEGRKG